MSTWVCRKVARPAKSDNLQGKTSQIGNIHPTKRRAIVPSVDQRVESHISGRVYITTARDVRESRRGDNHHHHPLAARKPPARRTGFAVGHALRLVSCMYAFVRISPGMHVEQSMLLELTSIFNRASVGSATVTSSKMGPDQTCTSIPVYAPDVGS
jgi:hypothetical protein